uniref:PIPK domain-containing protein n=1 Tax=Onchocerca flexuosa TaxID=387005 RepID=A0A183HQN6_9BILA
LITLSSIRSSFIQLHCFCKLYYSSDDLNSSNDTDNDEWLRGIGISPRKTLKITRNKSVMSNHSLDYERSLSLDPDFMDENRKSAIVLSDLDSIAAFYNMMTTSNFGRVATGPQAGFPPTLLARQPFLNAVLKNLKCQYREFTKDGTDFYVCEWDNGPIMPHMLSMLENFLRHSSKPNQENFITGQISGRFKCPGMNDAAGLGAMANFSSFEFRLGSFFKS